MSAPEIIQQLVERFEKNRAAFLSRSYKEAFRAHAVHTPARRRSRRGSSARYHCVAQVESTDAQIDRLVYELYGLTEEEIRIVDGPPPGLPQMPKNTEFGGGE